MFIRFFAPCDDTPTGKMALSYADAFAGLGIPIRILATRSVQLQHALAGSWVRHRGAFLTPIVGTFVNVVCGEPFDWHRLYTINVKNVLLASSPPAEDRGKDRTFAVEVGRRYDHVIVPSEEISSEWRALGVRPVVIPMELGPHAMTLRALLEQRSPSQPAPV